MNEYYHWYKEHGICVICQQEDAQPGYTMCLSCRMEHRLKGDTHSDEAKARHRKYLKRRRDLLYAFGVCVVCGVKDAKKGSHVCPYCLAKSRQRSENYRRQKGIIPRNNYTKIPRHTASLLHDFRNLVFLRKIQERTMQYE